MIKRITQLILVAGLVLAPVFSIWAQTPGMITKPAIPPGKAVLDPDGDGYVSLKTNGVQLGFTIPPNDDVFHSEIPFVNMDKLDPIGDLLRGPTGAFSEIVGVDAAGNYAIMWYSDGTNLLFRFRIDYFAPNSKSYSILFDTDSKIGFTGIQADPNAVTGNPGFEVEIVLETNFNVKAYNVDGVTAGTLIASFSYDTNCQKALAVTTSSGDPDFFYDFYLPYSSVSSMFSSGTPLRHISLTSMNPHPAIGNNAQSDVGGYGTGVGSLDQQFIDHLSKETPTLPGGFILPRSACPIVNAVSTASTSITGTSTEASGTSITVRVYQSNGTTLLGGATTTTSGTTWSILVSSLSPAVALAAGQIVKATATAVEKGTSADDCSIQTITSCAGNTSTSVTMTRISGGKGYSITNTFAAGTIFTWYNADYTLATYPDKNGSLVNIPNPVTSATASQTVLFSTQTGQTFPDRVYYFTFQEPGKCVSAYLTDCQYSVGGSSVAPVITTTPITTTTTSISGTCGSSTGTLINLFADGALLTSTTVVSSTSWTITGLNLTNYSCASITASATQPGQCATPTATGVMVTHPGLKPTINTSGCSLTSPVTSISGFSNDADGTIITLYKTGTPDISLGTGTVTSGAWTVTPTPSLVSTNVIYARVTSGTCVTTGEVSDQVTISTKTSITSYTIAITAPTEGESSVSGTITGGTYPTTLKLYIDQTLIGAGITVNAAGTWTVGSLLSSDLYIGGTLNVTLTGAGECESDRSAASAIVQCLQPATPTYTGGHFAYCVGGAGSITLTTTEDLVIYQLVDGTGAVAGPGIVGTGGSVTLTTNAINTNVGPLYVKAFKLANASCSSTAAIAVYYDIPSPTPSVTFTNTAVSVARGTTTVNLPFSTKSVTPSADTYTIDYTILAENQGFLDITTPTAIPSAPGNIALVVPSNPALGTYTGTIAVAATAGSTCTTYYGFTVTVYSLTSPPVISVNPFTTTICSGSTYSMSVTAINATGYQWQQSIVSGDGPFTNCSTGTGATTANYTTPALSVKTYYRCIVSNASGNTTSTVASVFITALPSAGAITGNTSVCAGQTLVPYSITALENATSYTWSYSGTNVTINGTTNSITLTFAANATSGTLSVTGNNSCGAGTAATLAITVNPAPFINNMTAASCSGGAFTVTPVNVTNGTVPAGTTYSWAAPVVTGGLTGGASGSGASAITGTLTNPTTTVQTATYTVTPVKGSCTGATFTVTVEVNGRIALSASAIDATCNGGSTGSINLTVSGGTPTYSYAWTATGGFTATSQNLSTLAAKTYTVTVTDSNANHCTATTAATVSQPASAISVTPSVTNITCNGALTGQISLAVTGGTPLAAPTYYTYLWNDGSASKDRTGLATGNYSVTVTDANGCTGSSGTIAVTQPTVISASAGFSAISCNGGTSTITVTASGGTGTLNYSLNGGSYQTANTFTGISASATPYSITVKDANNCTTTTTVTVTQPVALALSTVVTNATCPGDSNGSILLSVSGGTSPYTYLWAGGTTTQNRATIPAGTYSVTVTDANLCTAAISVTLTNLNADPATPGTIRK